MAILKEIFRPRMKLRQSASALPAHMADLLSQRRKRSPIHASASGPTSAWIAATPAAAPAWPSSLPSSRRPERMKKLKHLYSNLSGSWDGRETLARHSFRQAILQRCSRRDLKSKLQGVHSILQISPEIPIALWYIECEWMHANQMSKDMEL